MPADFRVSITDASGQDAYPISSFTWMLVPSVITDPAKHAAIIQFLEWGLTKGQDYLEPLSYARLPDAVIAREQKALANIKLSSATEASQQMPLSVDTDFASALRPDLMPGSSGHSDPGHRPKSHIARCVAKF
jgi:hypothetical protein